MIAPPAGVKVLVATKPIDFRKGANGLAALIKDETEYGEARCAPTRSAE